MLKIFVIPLILIIVSIHMKNGQFQTITLQKQSKIPQQQNLINNFFYSIQWDVFLIAGIILMLIQGSSKFYSYYLPQNQQIFSKVQKQKRQNIEQIMNHYQNKERQEPKIKNNKHKKKIKQLISNSWIILEQQNNRMPTKIINLKELKDQIYSIKMVAIDSKGSNKLTGLLIFEKETIALYFQKTYDNEKNQTKVNQTDKFGILLYQGVLKQKKFVGKWYYQNYENDPKYSGTWEMIHQELNQ